LWLLPVVGFTAALQGFESTAVFRLSRQLLRGRLALLELIPYLINLTVMFGWIWYLARHWSTTSRDDPVLQARQLVALAAGTVAAALCRLVLSYVIYPGFRHGFCLDREVRAQLLHFGGWLFVSSACTFLAAQADRLVVGRISLDVLGVYHVGAQLAAIPTTLMLVLGNQLIFPLYSRALHAGLDLRGVLARSHPFFTGFAAFLVSGLASTGPTVVRCLYRSDYSDAGWYVQLLAVVSWLTLIQATRNMALLAMGRTRAQALGHVLRLLSLPALMFSGAYLGGITGLILGFAASEFLRYMVNVYLVREQRGAVFQNDLPLSLLIVVTCVASAQIESLILEPSSLLVRLAFEVSFVLVLWGMIFAMWWATKQGFLGKVLWPLRVEKTQA
jgi:O-antigen/teichoic acid export membrane protein